MIDGLKLDIPSSDLAAHLQARREYHEERTSFYMTQAAALRAGGVVAQFQTNDPTRSLDASAEEHKRKAAFFGLMGKYLVPDETYRVTEHDLTRLELVWG